MDWLLLYMAGGMRVPVGEPGAPGEGMLSCLNLGKSHRKDASEPGIAALPSLPRQTCLDQSPLPHRKGVSFPSSGLGPGPLRAQAAKDPQSQWDSLVLRAVGQPEDRGTPERGPTGSVLGGPRAGLSERPPSPHPRLFRQLPTIGTASRAGCASPRVSGWRRANQTQAG